MKKIDGRLIIDEFQALDKIVERWDVILTASCNDGDNGQVWRDILDDEGYNLLLGLRKIQEKIAEKSSVTEYIQDLFRRFDTETV